MTFHDPKVLAAAEAIERAEKTAEFLEILLDERDTIVGPEIPFSLTAHGDQKTYGWSTDREWMAKEMGIEVDQVTQAAQALQDLGIIQINTRPFKPTTITMMQGRDQAYRTMGSHQDTLDRELSVAQGQGDLFDLLEALPAVLVEAYGLDAVDALQAPDCSLRIIEVGSETWVKWSTNGGHVDTGPMTEGAAAALVEDLKATGYRDAEVFSKKITRGVLTHMSPKAI